jgi:hypothetical protein
LAVAWGLSPFFIGGFMIIFDIDGILREVDSEEDLEEE